MVRVEESRLCGAEESNYLKIFVTWGGAPILGLPTGVTEAKTEVYMTSTAVL